LFVGGLSTGWKKPKPVDLVGRLRFDVALRKLWPLVADPSRFVGRRGTIRGDHRNLQGLTLIVGRLFIAGLAFDSSFPAMLLRSSLPQLL
jgi:hypothetical protein